MKRLAIGESWDESVVAALPVAADGVAVAWFAVSAPMP